MCEYIKKKNTYFCVYCRWPSLSSFSCTHCTHCTQRTGSALDPSQFYSYKLVHLSTVQYTIMNLKTVMFIDLIQDAFRF